MYNTNRYKPIEPNSGPRRAARKGKVSNKANDRKKINTITYNQCVNLIKQQQQEDNSVTKSYQKTAIIRGQQKLAVIIRKKETHKDLVRYLHAACFSPVASTWEKAIKKDYFQTWPGLTRQIVARHLPPSVATVQGHIHKQWQHLQRTKKIETASVDERSTQDMHPNTLTPNLKENCVAYGVINKEELVTAYKDLTGRFLVRSTAGNKYILVGYHFDANCILGHPVRNRTGPVLTKAWEHLQSEFEKAGLAPEVWILDNEISKELKDSFHKRE